MPILVCGAYRRRIAGAKKPAVDATAGASFLFLLAAAVLLPAVNPVISAMSTAIVASICILATAIQLPVDAIAFAIEPFRAFRMPVLSSTIGLPVEMPVDTVSSRIQPIFDAIASCVETLLDPVARIGEGGSIQQQQNGDRVNQFPRIHDVSPRIHTMIVSTVPTTAVAPIG